MPPPSDLITVPTPDLEGPPDDLVDAAPSPVWKRVLRYLNLGAKGINDVVLETLTAIPEASSSVARLAGLPSLEPGAMSEGLKQGVQDVGRAASDLVTGGARIGPRGPQDRGEKIAYKTGRGIGGVASIAAPAAATARLARAGSTTANVASQIAARPTMQTAAGAVGGAVEGATDNPYYGMAASMAVPFTTAGARRLVTPVPRTLSPEQIRLQGVAAREGIPLSTAQQTGSRTLKLVESVLDDLPFSGGMGQARQQAQQTAFNRAVLRRAGINADAATPDVLAEATSRLGAEFDRLSRGTLVNLDRTFQRRMMEVSARYMRKLPSATRAVFRNYYDDLTDYVARGSNRDMAGEVYQATRSDLGKHAKSLANSDPMLSQALFGLRDALDDAMTRSIPAANSGAWRDVRRQYSALKQILNTMSKPSAGAAAGDISPASLWSSARQAMTKDQFARGGGDLNDLARVGQAYVKGQIPNSGTSQRNMMIKMLQGVAPAGASVATAGDPLTTAASIGTAFGGPPALANFLQSDIGRRYMLNQALAQRIQPLTLGTLSSIGAGRALAQE